MTEKDFNNMLGALLSCGAQGGLTAEDMKESLEMTVKDDQIWAGVRAVGAASPERFVQLGQQLADEDPLKGL